MGGKIFLIFIFLKPLVSINKSEEKIFKNLPDYLYLILASSLKYRRMIKINNNNFFDNIYCN
jgi:hypothetical protein